MAAESAGAGRPYRLHIENIANKHEVFQITPERYSAAEARHPELAALLDTTIGYDLEDFPKVAPEIDFTIGWELPFRSLAETAPKLKVVHIIGAGVEHLFPLDWLPAGVSVTSNRGVATKAGEYVTVAVLALNTWVPFYATSKELRRWERVFVSGIEGKTLLVIGMGNLGRSGARRCKEMGMRVLGVRASGAPDEAVHEMYRPEDLPRLLPQADFVLVAVPLTDRTRGLIGAEQFAQMKPGAGFINIARAAIVDQEALGRALVSGQLSGAVLDVFDKEPLPADSPVWSWPNCILTPHVSADDVTRYMADTLDLFFENFQRFVDGRPLKNVVDPDRQY